MNFYLFLALFVTLAVKETHCGYLLATDAVNVLDNPLKTQFRCIKTGYFADIDNNCQMYHVCVVQQKPTGHKVIRQYSFVCGNGTLFNQLTLTCDDPQESLPCEDAPQYYNMNKKVGEPNTWFHNGNDYHSYDGYDKESSGYYDSSSESAYAYTPYQSRRTYRSRTPIYAYRPSRYRPNYDPMDTYLEASESIERPITYPIASPRRVKPEIYEPINRQGRESMAVDGPGIYTFVRKRNPKYGLL